MLRRHSGRSLALVAFTLVVGLASPRPAEAQVHVGPQLSIADDVDAGLGGRALFNLHGLSGWEGVTSFDVFFPDGPVDYWELNGNVIYNFPVEETHTFLPYAGTGINLARIEGSRGVDDTELGVNLVGGTKFQTENVTPYVELRVELEGGEQVVFTGGILVP